MNFSGLCRILLNILEFPEISSSTRFSNEESNSGLTFVLPRFKFVIEEPSSFLENDVINAFDPFEPILL
jgi:hypothetical protein